jgi:hypothetical protein
MITILPGIENYLLRSGVNLQIFNIQEDVSTLTLLNFRQRRYGSNNSESSITFHFNTTWAEYDFVRHCIQYSIYPRINVDINDLHTCTRAFNTLNLLIPELPAILLGPVTPEYLASLTQYLRNNTTRSNNNVMCV